MKIEIGESGRGGYCGKEARRGEGKTKKKKSKVEESEKKNNNPGLKSAQFVATMWRL